MGVMLWCRESVDETSTKNIQKAKKIVCVCERRGEAFFHFKGLAFLI